MRETGWWLEAVIKGVQGILYINKWADQSLHSEPSRC